MAVAQRLKRSWPACETATSQKRPLIICKSDARLDSMQDPLKLESQNKMVPLKDLARAIHPSLNFSSFHPGSALASQEWIQQDQEQKLSDTEPLSPESIDESQADYEQSGLQRKENLNRLNRSQGLPLPSSYKDQQESFDEVSSPLSPGVDSSDQESSSSLSSPLLSHSRDISFQKSEEKPRKHSTLCTEHNQNFVAVCYEDRTPVCWSCLSKHQPAHRFLFLEYYAVHDNGVSKLVSDVATTFQQLQERKQQIDNVLQQVDDQAASLRQEASKVYDTMIQWIEKSRAETLSGIDKLAAAKQQKLASQSATIQHSIGKLAQNLDEIKLTVDSEDNIGYAKKEKEITDIIGESKGQQLTPSAFPDLLLAESKALQLLRLHPPIKAFEMARNQSCLTTGMGLMRCRPGRNTIKIEVKDQSRDACKGLSASAFKIELTNPALSRIKYEAKTHIEEDNPPGTYLLSYDLPLLHPSSLCGDKNVNISISLAGYPLPGSPFIVPFQWGVEGLYQKQICRKGTGSGQLLYPRGIASSSNYVAVADCKNHRVVVLNKDTGLLAKVIGNDPPRSGSMNGTFNLPHDVAIENHRFFVVDTNNHRVQVFDSKGNFLLRFGIEGDGDGELKSPSGIATHRNEVYLADSHNHRISVFTHDGRYLRSFGEPGQGLGKLSYPWHICIANDVIYVADTCNHRIQVFDLHGSFIKAFGSKGKRDGQLLFPYRICCVGWELYVCDSGNHRICVFDVTTGIFLRKWGKFGSDTGQFRRTFGFTLCEDGTAIVVDENNHRLQVFG